MSQPFIDGTFKMLHPKGVEVYIKSLDRDKPYVEYIQPGDSDPWDNVATRFIEATASEHFSIAVRLRSNCDFRGQSHIRIDSSIDSSVLSSCRSIRVNSPLISLFEQSQGFGCVHGTWYKS